MQIARMSSRGTFRKPTRKVLVKALQGFHPSLTKYPGDLARAWEHAREVIQAALTAKP